MDSPWSDEINILPISIFDDKIAIQQAKTYMIKSIFKNLMCNSFIIDCTDLVILY